MRDRMIKICLILLAFFINLKVTFCQQNEQSQSSGQPMLQVGYSIHIFQDVNIKDAEAVTKILAEIIVKKKTLDFPSETYIFEDVSKIKAALNSDRLDVIALTALEYLEICDQAPLEAAFVPEANNQVYDSFLFIVHGESGSKKLHDLKGKRLNLSVAMMYGSLRLWLDTILMREGLPPSEKFFSSINVVNKSSQALLPVFFRQADVCLITKNAFEIMVSLNPQLGQELTILAESPSFVKAIIGINKNQKTEDYKKLIEESLAELHQESNGQQLLSIFRMDKLVPFKTEYLKSINELLREHHQLKRKMKGNR